MANEPLGASFTIDVTNLKAGLAQANRMIRESESEFKAAAAGMDDWTKSQEGLEARIKHLNNAADLQRKKVDALQSEYDRLVDEGLDPTSAELVKLRTDINKEKEALAKAEKEIKKQTDALENLENAAKDAGEAVEETGDAAEDAGDGFTVAKGAVASFIGNGLSALVGACKNAIGSIVGLAESTREYRSIMASLDNSSAQAGYTVDETAATFKQLNGVLGDTQGAATTTANLQAIGLEQSKLQNLTNGVIGAWAKYGDSIPIDGLGEAINHTAQLGEVQGTLADVLEWGGLSVEDFNAKLAECTNETERADLIAKMLADQGLTEAGEAWQENNKSIVDANNAQAEYEKQTAKMGKKIEPITVKIREGFNKILEKVLELVEDVDFDKLGKTIDNAFDKFVNDIMPKIVDGLTWVTDNKDAVIAGVVGIGAAFLAWKAVSIIQAVTNAMKGMTIAQAALNLVMSLNPIGLIVAAVAGLVAAFVVLWNKCEGFRNFWIGLWDGIKNAAAAVADWFVQAWQVVSDFFVNLWSGIKSTLSTFGSWVYANVIEPVKNFFVNLWNGIVQAYHTVIDPWLEIFKRVAAIVNEKIVQPVKKFFTDLWNSLRTGATNVWNGIKAVFSVVSGWFNKTIISPVKTAFSNMWNGLKTGASNAWSGIKSVFSKVASFFGDIFGAAWKKVKDVFSVGGKIFDGIKDGIVTAFKTVVNAIIRGINKVVAIPFKGLNGILDKIHGVSILGVKPFEWLKWRATVPEIPELAKGGVVRGATHAIIGEDGAEAVVPLERNRQWIREVAQELAAQQKQGVVVNQTNNYSQAHSRYELYKSKEQTAAAVKLALLGV